jgi:DNA-directed RNA polymerase specialized sigma subunit
VRFKAREVEKAYAALDNPLHRSPTDAEVAQQLGITTEELHQIFNQISFVSVVALDDLGVGRLRAGRRAQPGRHAGGQGPRIRWPCSSRRS